ncbi:MAG: polysaccharide deacetylase family protein [Desulfomonile tiedjei]|uniref:Polysaccharide deacetylase family protein n=1 Tax=Desulfomonile tiedjei TaxID=2358 RepID=A0A9D6V3N6_9BACT|nr:polysaccharide deacetylase family protein [Desulfomonile tiedjei]
MNPRWVLKRAAKWVVEWGMTLCGGGIAYRRSAKFREGFRILAYHGVADTPLDSYTVQTDHFRYHMEYLSDNFRVVDLAELTQALKEGAKPPENTMAVTFDDGYKECAKSVAEILDRYRIPATFFVVTDILDGKIKSPSREFLSWDDVRALALAGFSFGSHTSSHHSLGALSFSEVMRELTESRNRIQEELGGAPVGLAYPYGTMRDFSPDVAAAAQRAGYIYAVTAVHGLNHKGCDPFTLRRTSLTAGDGARTFRMIMRGCLDPWQIVDRWGYRLQRPSAGGLGQ